MTTVRSAGSRSSESSNVAARARRAGVVPRVEPVPEGGRLRLAERGPRPGRLRRNGIGVVLGGFVIMAMLFAFAVVGTIIVGEQARVDRTNARIVAAEARAEQLRAELAELKSPQYVTTRASTVLGMIPAPTPVYLQPRATDDERASEVPVTTPPTTSRPATNATTPTTARSATTTTVKR